MTTASPRLHTPHLPWLLIVVGVVASGLYLVAIDTFRSTDGLGTAVVLGCSLIAALAIFSRLRYPDAWRSALWFAIAYLSVAAVSTVFLYRELTEPVSRPGTVAVLLPVFLLFLVPAAIEIHAHVPREDRPDIVADIALLAVAAGVAVYLLLRPEDVTIGGAVPSMVAALMVATALGAYAALALWIPNGAHLGQLAAICALAAGFVDVIHWWIEGVSVQGRPLTDLSLSLSALLTAFLVNLIPRRTGRRHPAAYGRAALTTIAVAAACVALLLTASMETTGRLEAGEANVLVAVLALAVAARVLVSLVRNTNAQRAAQEALADKEQALRETDQALVRLQRANETLRESQERLGTVFDSAVDGIVELDHRGVIVGTNEAFCRMVELTQDAIEDQPWSALAASIDADESFATLPQTGQGTLHREGHAIYLESRISEIPGDPPRRLLLVRDVTASRVADQTIRSLFKFLQDRDEDRTRIMRRTNAAIESERNRIARDLHDGPVQGVSAASLSLEAALLMLKAGEHDEGIEILTKIRRELSEEADNLRRLMSGLRPPLLEERGLFPALREMLDKYGRDNGVQTEFVGRGTSEIPSDLETLAYRIVQEALSNSAKHSQASNVSLTVEAITGQLRIEVADDGLGFDSSKAREYLQMGRVGLASMRERVELASGTFMVHSTPGKGTTVMATLPLEALPAAREFVAHEAS